jgi:shikimate kinase
MINPGGSGMTNSPHNIVLNGFMGTGKSTVGRLAAARLGMAFVDTDDLIVQEAGKSIPEIFAEDGESHFRSIESQVCQKAAGWPDYVISTGGGALVNPDNLAKFLQNSLVICLTASLYAIMGRVGSGSDRPLYGDREALERLYNRRASIYNSLPHQIDTTNLTPDQVTEEIIRLWDQER